MLPLMLLISGCDEETGGDSSVPITLHRPPLTLTVDPALGGRITSLQHNGRELLSTQRDSMNYALGSTAWPSPQMDWNWPPPPVLDSEPYEVLRVDDSTGVVLTSKTDPVTGLKLQKKIRLGPKSDVGITYFFTNMTDSLKTVAGWEVTRLPYAGELLFYADSIRTGRPEELVYESIQEEDRRYRIRFDERHQRSEKLFADLDSVPVVYRNNGLELAKYTGITDLYHTAPDQAPLEVFIAPKDKFIEFELQGYYRPIEYGEMSTLRTRWVVREVE